MDMLLFSQRDPAYGSMKLGKSKLTMSGYGCFVASIATLYQVKPEELLGVEGAFKDDGNLIAGVLAKHCGGAALAATTTAPEGWCVAVTDHYRNAGVPTHFFPYNAKTGERIDPLDFPAKVEKNDYKIIQYRPFTNTKLDTSKPVPVPLFPDVPAGSELEKDIKLCKDNGVLQGYPDGLFRPLQPLTRGEAAHIAARLLRAR